MTETLTTLSHRRAWLALVVLAPLTFACGNSTPSDDGAAGSGHEMDAGLPDAMTTPTCPDPNEAIDPTAVIDDLEDQNGMLLPVNGRSGGWWTAGDDTAGATIVPEPAELTGMSALPEAIPGGRCGSTYAMRVTGQGFRDWGSLLGISLAYGTRPNGQEGGIPYDASDRQGVDFWARIGDTSTNQVRFGLSDSSTEPDGGLCQEGGGTGLDCYDTFGVYLTQLDTTWRHYRIPFAGLAQEQFGYTADGVTASALYTIQFAFDTDAIFDLWIDDISFY